MAKPESTLYTAVGTASVGLQGGVGGIPALMIENILRRLEAVLDGVTGTMKGRKPRDGSTHLG